MRFECDSTVFTEAELSRVDPNDRYQGAVSYWQSQQSSEESERNNMSAPEDRPISDEVVVIAFGIKIYQWKSK